MVTGNRLETAGRWRPRRGALSSKVRTGCDGCDLAEHGPCDQASLGGLTAIDRTTAQVVCGNLSKLGLVTRTRSRVDKRAKVIAITPAGRELLRAAVPLVERTRQRIVAPLTPRERETLTRLLGKIADKNNAESRAPYKPRLARARRSRTERAGES